MPISPMATPPSPDPPGWPATVARLDAALDALASQVSGTALAGMPEPEAVARLAELQRLRSRLDAIAVAALADAGTLDGSSTTGQRSVATLVAAESKAAPRSVRADQRLGLWLVDHPVLAESFAAGRISAAHVRAIRSREHARTRPHLPRAEAYLAEAAEQCGWAEFQAVLRYWELAADPDGEEPEEQLSARSCAVTKHLDGTVTGRFTLDPLAGQALLDALERRYQHLFRLDAESGEARTASQRRADALVELVTGSGDARRPAPLVHLVLSEALAERYLQRPDDRCGLPPPSTLAPDHDDLDRRCELVDGTPLHPHLALGALAAAQLRRLVLSADGERLDLGRTVRTFPPQLKQALLVRARGRCEAHGCDAPVSWLQADHLVPWARGGSTSIANGQVLCDPHNKAKRDRPPPDPGPG